ncbi:MAG: hypothetical protein K8I00_00010, partial [Candidatus Omnitrophica bacterium]|nr:hypothetical protein [Candidatus Omnitrophota bacterium]
FLEKADEPGVAKHENNLAKTGHCSCTTALAVGLHYQESVIVICVSTFSFHDAHPVSAPVRKRMVMIARMNGPRMWLLKIP